MINNLNLFIMYLKIPKKTILILAFVSSIFLFNGFSNRIAFTSEVNAAIKENVAAITSVPMQWGPYCTQGCTMVDADMWDLCVMCNYPGNCILLFSNRGIGTGGMCIVNPD